MFLIVPINIFYTHAGEILLTSMDRDGTKKGYDLELTKKVSDLVNIPVIASGGVGSLEHLYQGFKIGKASAVLAASIFHFLLLWAIFLEVLVINLKVLQVEMHLKQ